MKLFSTIHSQRQTFFCFLLFLHAIISSLIRSRHAHQLAFSKLVQSFRAVINELGSFFISLLSHMKTHPRFSLVIIRTLCHATFLSNETNTHSPADKKVSKMNDNLMLNDKKWRFETVWQTLDNSIVGENIKVMTFVFFSVKALNFLKKSNKLTESTFQVNQFSFRLQPER